MANRAHRYLKGTRVSSEELAPGLQRIHLSNRLIRAFNFEVNCFRVDDLLVDSAYHHDGPALIEALAAAKLRGIALTHHHEDHCGNAAALATQHACPIYLGRPELRQTEGLNRLLPYRRLWWGSPTPYSPRPMPVELSTAQRTLIALPTPGHSATHTAFFDPESGWALVGDLYLSAGVTPTMPQENPGELAASLRRLAELRPRHMANAHGKIVHDPVARLGEKAERLDTAAAEVRRLHSAGAGVDEIVARVFGPPGPQICFSQWMSQGDYSYRCFVQGSLREARAAGPLAGA